MGAPALRPSPSERLAVRFRKLPRQGFAHAVARMSDDQVLAALYDWAGLWARPDQLLPAGDWDTTIWLAGRGYGKTRTGGEIQHDWAREGQAAPMGIIARTAADCREVIVEGPAGLLVNAKPWFRPKYEPSKRRVSWPNGVIAQLYSADEPDRIRGANLSKLWCDELCAWNTTEAWDMAQFALRAGRRPQAIITTTPKPIDLLIKLIKNPRTKVIKGSTLANARNLPASYLARMLDVYGGTRLGRQELDAEILLDSGQLFNVQHFLGALRIVKAETIEALIEELKLVRIVVAVDPAPTSNTGSDFTGIWVMGIDEARHLFALEDATVKGSPQEWGNAVINAFHRWKADRVVGEVNVGGEMVGSLLHTIDPNLPFKEVRAGRGAGKGKRAEPVAALVEQGRVHLVGHRDNWEKFLEQAHVFTGQNGKRDDRVDAFLWAAHELALGGESLQLI